MSIGHLVKVQDEPLPRVDVLRYTTALNYTLIGMVVMTVFALTVLAVSVIVLRTEMLGRWVGYVGLGCGVLVLVAASAMFGAVHHPDRDPLGLVHGGGDLEGVHPSPPPRSQQAQETARSPDP